MSQMVPDLKDRDVRCLLTVIAVADRDGRATMRSVAAAWDRGLTTTHKTLRHLHDLGFVVYEPERRGTLRPLLTVL